MSFDAEPDPEEMLPPWRWTARHWLTLLALGGVLLVAFLPRAAPVASSGEMKTAARPAKPRPRSLPRRAIKLTKRDYDLDALDAAPASRGTPPPAKGTAADLLAALDDGSYAAAAAKGDWAAVETTAKGRRSRHLRAA